jgi:tripartite-type tricarboxylate transporter receptor subunit TctC
MTANRIRSLTICVLAAVSACAAQAQDAYPEKPVRVLVGFPPGSQADTVARLLGQKLGETMGRPVTVDNAAGAAGNIAADRLAKSAADGYTLGVLGEVQVVVNPYLYKLSFDPASAFAPIAEVAAYPNLLVVGQGVPATNLGDIVAMARARPGELTFASGGSGSSPHMAAELFKSVAGVDIRHIPYKGVVMAVPDVLSGRVTMMFSPIGIALPSVRAGKLKAVAVTSPKRSAVVPELPTIAEAGYPGYEYTGWYGLFAPAGTPAAIMRRLHAQTVGALQDRELRTKLVDLGMEPTGTSPDQFTAAIKTSLPKQAKLIAESGMKPD